MNRCLESRDLLAERLTCHEEKGHSLTGGLANEWLADGLLDRLDPCPAGGHYFLVAGGAAICTSCSRVEDGPVWLRPALEVLAGRSPHNSRFACYARQEEFLLEPDLPVRCPGGAAFLCDAQHEVRCEIHGPARPQPLSKPGLPAVVHLPRAWLLARHRSR